METTVDPSVVLLPSPAETGHRLSCSVCHGQAALQPAAPWVQQIRDFAQVHRH